MSPLLFALACATPSSSSPPAAVPPGAPPAAPAAAAYRSTDTAALAAALATPTPPLVLDVRTPGEFAQGHVPGAKNVPVDTLASNLGSLEKGKEIYVICQSGRRSAAASALLAEKGYTPLDVTGGTAKWIAEGRPVDK